MKTIIILAIMALVSNPTFGQKYSLEVDSLTQEYIKRLPNNIQQEFNEILNQRQKSDLFNRIDTTSFDYAFIEESYCTDDTLVQMTERYFLTKEKKALLENLKTPANEWIILPYQLYFNGISQNVLTKYYANTVVYTYYYGLIDDYYTLDTVLVYCSQLQPTQELSYDKTQIWDDYRLYYNFEEKKKTLEKSIEERLKKTYQIVTLINHVDKKVIVSVQVPAENPKVKLRYLTRTNDW